MTVPQATSATSDSSAKSDLVKTTRQQVFDRLRSDWAFDPRDVSSHANGSHGPDAADSKSESSYVDGVELVREDDVTEWRERTYASSDPSDDENDKPLAVSKKVNGTATNGNTKVSVNGDTTSDAQKKQARKRRRRERLREELEWNEGLRFWEARRDAWCCARRVSASASASASSSSSDSAKDSLKTPTSSSDSASPTTSSSAATIPAASHDTLTLLPLAPPLLPPTDPTRAIISPSYYPSIFNKVVTQSLTPSIPINLSHMVPALVHGWKTNGDWPPKGSFIATPGTTMSSTAAQDAAKRDHGVGGLGIDRKISGAKDRLLKKYHQRHGQREEGNANGNGNGDESSSPVGGGGGKGVGMLKGVAKVGKVFKFSFSGGGDEKG